MGQELDEILHTFDGLCDELSTWLTLEEFESVANRLVCLKIFLLDLQFAF